MLFATPVTSHVKDSLIYEQQIYAALTVPMKEGSFLPIVVTAELLISEFSLPLVVCVRT